MMEVLTEAAALVLYTALLAARPTTRFHDTVRPTHLTRCSHLTELATNNRHRGSLPLLTEPWTVLCCLILQVVNIHCRPEERSSL